MGSALIECNECKRPTAPRRVRTIKVFARARKRVYHFCLDCHGAVYAAADGRKYPDLFEDCLPWRDEFAEWNTAVEIAQLLGLSGKGFSKRWTCNEGYVLGIKFIRATDENDKLFIYQGVKNEF